MIDQEIIKRLQYYQNHYNHFPEELLITKIHACIEVCGTQLRKQYNITAQEFPINCYEVKFFDSIYKIVRKCLKEEFRIGKKEHKNLEGEEINKYEDQMVEECDGLHLLENLGYRPVGQGYINSDPKRVQIYHGGMHTTSINNEGINLGYDLGMGCSVDELMECFNNSDYYWGESDPLKPA